MSAPNVILVGDYSSRQRQQLETGFLLIQLVIWLS